MTINDLVRFFTGVPKSHPSRRAHVRHRSNYGQRPSGNSKWHRRVLAAGLKGQCCLILAVVLSVLACSPAFAFGGRFRGGSCANGTCSMPAAAPTYAAQTQPHVSHSPSVPHPTAATHETSTAQGVANIMARLGRVGHFGGNRGYEGCGMASTPQAAHAACCFANSGMKTVDVGFARSRSGLWFCCRRYSGQ